MPAWMLLILGSRERGGEVVLVVLVDDDDDDDDDEEEGEKEGEEGEKDEVNDGHESGDPLVIAELTNLLTKEGTQGNLRSWLPTNTFRTKGFGEQLCCKGQRQCRDGHEESWSAIH